MASETEIIDAYLKGEIDARDLCLAMRDGRVSAGKVAELLKVPKERVGEFCNELLREEARVPRIISSLKSSNSGLGEEELPSSYGGRRGRGYSYSVTALMETNPIAEAIKAVATAAADVAVQDITFFKDFGERVYRVAYWFCAQHPLYKDELLNNPKDTVSRFVDHAISFYIGWMNILDRFDAMISELRGIIEEQQRIIEMYKRVVARLARRAAPSYIDEIAMNVLVALLDRIIVARALGIRVDKKLLRFVASWLEAKGAEQLYKFMGEALGLSPQELAKVVKG
jgi:hypothetical protein